MAKSLHAGNLRHRVRFESKVFDMDSEGNQIEEWVDATGLISAEIAPLSGRELIAAQGVQSKVTTRIRIRWRPGLDAEMRVVHREQVYDVHALVEDQESGRRYLTAHCSRGVNLG